jgi:hypothetical protein
MRSQDRHPALATREVALLVALLACFALFAWHIRARGIFTFGDDSAYILLSRSLRAFSYREIQFIDEPIGARFPPGYPAILAITSLFGEHLRLMVAVGVALSVSALFALFDVVRRRWSPELALVATAVVATNPVFAADAGAIASEGAFAALTLWSLWAADRCVDGERRGVVAGATAIAAAFVRSAGVTLPLALGAHWLLRRKFRMVALMALATCLTVGVWLAWTAAAPKREVRRSYIDDAVNARPHSSSLSMTLVVRVKDNTSAYVAQMAPEALGLPLLKNTRLDNLAWAAFIGILALAGGLSAWFRWNAGAIWAAGYAALLGIWAFPLERFLHPLLPLLLTFMVIGAWTIVWRFAAATTAVRAAAVVGALLIGLGFRGDVALADQAAACDRSRADCAAPESLDFVDAAKYVSTHTSADSRLLVPKNATLYYYAPRKSVFFDEAIAQTTETFLPFLERNRVEYILATPVYFGRLNVASLSLAHCRQLDLVKAFAPETILLRRRETPTPDDHTAACRALARIVARQTPTDDPRYNGRFTREAAP